MVVQGKDPSIQSEFRENYMKWWIKVEGITHGDVRQLSEKIGEQPEQQSETEKSAEFSIPSWIVGKLF
jgi:hypothetical protein